MRLSHLVLGVGIALFIAGLLIGSVLVIAAGAVLTFLGIIRA